LKRDYPLVAPAYHERRSQVAKQLGLGRKITAKTESAAPKPSPKPRGKRSAAAP
jgi:predicted transcriptional regulator